MFRSQVWLLVLPLCQGLVLARGNEATPVPAPASEAELRKQLGPDTPVPVPLWPKSPPRFQADAPPETVDTEARIKSVSVPTLSVYHAPRHAANGMALIVCPGGGYGGLDWKTHVVYAARVFNAHGVAVIGLKYRTRPPFRGDNEAIQSLALSDAQRAVRLVRSRAGEWHLDPGRIGVAGYSAGANLAMNLACHWDRGDPGAADPVERLSCRPDFAVGLATWHWRRKESPFRFAADGPPVFLVHATNDGVEGGAPIELPRAIRRDLEALRVPVRMLEFDEGTHGVGNLVPQRVHNGFPPAMWPELLLNWLRDDVAMPATASPPRQPPAGSSGARGGANQG